MNFSKREYLLPLLPGIMTGIFLCILILLWRFTEIPNIAIAISFILTVVISWAIYILSLNKNNLKENDFVLVSKYANLCRAIKWTGDNTDKVMEFIHNSGYTADCHKTTNYVEIIIHYKYGDETITPNQYLLFVPGPLHPLKIISAQDLNQNYTIVTPIYHGFK